MRLRGTRFSGLFGGFILDADRGTESAPRHNRLVAMWIAARLRDIICADILRNLPVN
jgi:hypothetical protein